MCFSKAALKLSAGKKDYKFRDVNVSGTGSGILQSLSFPDTQTQWT